MSKMSILEFHLVTPNLDLKAHEVSWDSKVFGNPVMEIYHFNVFNISNAFNDFSQYLLWVKEQHIGMISCRLQHQNLIESMLLESSGFRFIEMVLHPYINNLQEFEITVDPLKILPAIDTDIEKLQSIAERAFFFERFYMDHRLDKNIASKRYCNWVKNTLSHRKQLLLKVINANRLVGFFIVEEIAPLTIYWHLTAIDPEFQGMGYGRQAWLSMMQFFKLKGFKSIETTISARNIRVLNLYAQIGFRFKPPQMTFHWLKS